MRSQVTRYALAAVVAFLLLLGLLLLVRPLIYSVAPPRDDSVYAVATAASVPSAAPLVKDLLLNASHGLLGERRSGEHAAITVVIARAQTGLFSVVNAWSPLNACARSMSRFTFCCGKALMGSRRMPETMSPRGCAWKTLSAGRDIQTSRSIMVPASEG